MTAAKKEPPVRRTSSQAMAAYREKMVSVEENTMPLVRDLHERIDRASRRAGVHSQVRSTPPTGEPSALSPQPENESEADTERPPPSGSTSSP